MSRWGEWSLEPETAAETEEAQTPQGMRKRLRRYAHYNAIARRAMDIAHVEGLSGEDEMTVLAYFALVQLEKMMDREMRRLSTEVAPGMVPGGA